jgi:dTDP-4-amino-4,6-dideoxygalactose transaminase
LPFNHPVNFAPLLGLYDQNGITKIEDEAKPSGGLNRGKRTGNWSSLCYEFNENKIITTRQRDSYPQSRRLRIAPGL